MYQFSKKDNRTGKGRDIVFGILCAIIALAIVGLVFMLTGNRERTVGTDIASEDITEFYYTEASSAYPPSYQRYRFYTEDDIHRFYHEKREGAVWPLTESHITVSGSIQLSDEDWTTFLGYLEGGTVKKREQNAESGGSGPALYLYWNGDRAIYQKFYFSSLRNQNLFEKFCAGLVGSMETISETP